MMEVVVWVTLMSGTLFVGFGLWHLACSSSCFIRSPAACSAKPWHPLPCLPHLQLYLLLALLPFFIAYHLAVSSNFDPLVRGSHFTFRTSSLLHAALLLLSWIFLLTSFLSETTSLLPLPREAPFLLAACAFAFEWKVLQFDAKITPGLESECDALLAAVAGICSIVSGLLAWQPEFFLAELALDMGIMLQGFWRLQMGLSLHVDPFIPQGCHRLLYVSGSVEGSTQCDLDSDRLRAIALMDFLFICYVVFVVLMAVATYCFVVKAEGRKRHLSLEAASTKSDWGHLQMEPF